MKEILSICAMQEITEKIIKFPQDSYKLWLCKFYTEMQRIYPFGRVEFAHACFKLSGDTRRIFTKLFEELVSHYFSFLITF